MEKYEFIKNGMDDYTLKYKDKTINFNSKVDYVKEMQESNKIARLRMVADLTNKGMSVKNLVKEEKKDGKTLIDNSNKEYIEQAYLQEVQQEIFNKIIEKMFGMTLEQLLIDVGIQTEEEIEVFTTNIANILIGRFPSKQQQ
jgi:uncharacterized protein YbcI